MTFCTSHNSVTLTYSLIFCYFYKQIHVRKSRVSHRVSYWLWQWLCPAIPTPPITSGIQSFLFYMTVDSYTIFSIFSGRLYKACILILKKMALLISCQQICLVYNNKCTNSSITDICENLQKLVAI